MSEMEPELAENIRQLMFTFEDLTKIDDQSMQVLVREIDKDKWVMAMRTASPALKKKIFANMSERAGALLKEEIESMGPVRLRDVEGAQTAVVRMIRALEAAGEIVIGGSDDDMVI